MVTNIRLHMNACKKKRCSGNDSDVVIPSLPCSDSQPADSPYFLMAGLGTKHRSLVPTVWNYLQIVTGYYLSDDPHIFVPLVCASGYNNFSRAILKFLERN